MTALAAGGGAKAVAEEAAKLKGLEKVLVAENEAYDKVNNATLEISPHTSQLTS